MVDKINLTERENRILDIAMHYEGRSVRDFNAQDVASVYEKENPRMIGISLRLMSNKGLLKDKGMLGREHIYSLTETGRKVFLATVEVAEQQHEVKITEKTKHLKIPTTEKETIISPVPNKLESTSVRSISGNLTGLQSNASVFYTSKDKKKMEFEEGKR